MKYLILMSLLFAGSASLATGYHLENPTPRGELIRQGFEIGSAYNDGLARHCLREQIGKVITVEYIETDFVSCQEDLFGTGDDELNAIQETYPNFEIPEEMQ